MTTFNESRAFSSADEGRFLTRGPFTLDLHTHMILLEERQIQVPPCTFSYLVTLARSAPQPVSYQKLVSDSQGRALSRLESQDMARVRVYMLRKAIGDEQINPSYIVAVSGFGYRLNA
jgi:DNA-binding response OmpR family regulator